jgi:hypothetical protein
MRLYTIKCKPCGRVLATTPRVTERVLSALRIHISHECPVRVSGIGDGGAGNVLRGVAVEDA